MAWKNKTYRGPDIMIELMRATNVPWQRRSMCNGYLISNGMYKERFKGGKTPLESMSTPLTADTEYGHKSERELRNLHSGSSSRTADTPDSKYVSMTSSKADTSWGQGSNPTYIYKFDIWRSDVWKGKHDLSRDPALQLWLTANILCLPPVQRDSVLSEQTPSDWDRGAEFEWLALGGTKIYNVKQSPDGVAWTPVVPTTANIDFWWESLA